MALVQQLAVLAKDSVRTHQQVELPQLLGGKVVQEPGQQRHAAAAGRITFRLHVVAAASAAALSRHAAATAARSPRRVRSGWRASELLEDDAEDLYENAPCGYLSTLLDGQIAKINATLLSWLGYARDELVGRRYFADLLTAGGRLYHETHFAPLLNMQGEIGGVALELRAADGTRLPVLVNSAVKTTAAGQPLLIRTTIFDARDRRAYERELLRARQEADHDRERLQRLVTTLQRSLLPPALPEVPGLDAAAHYHIASADEVGGDFYDLFALGRERWGLFLGDVSGKGASAAAATSLIRYTLRAAAVYDADPAAVLGTLNTVMHDEYERDGQHFCTAVFGFLSPASGGFTVTLAAGGHPAPLLIRH